jgi:hypothetical protein
MILLVAPTQCCCWERPSAWSVDDILSWEKTYGQVPRGSFAAAHLHVEGLTGPGKFKPTVPARSLAAVVRRAAASPPSATRRSTDTTDKMEFETWLLQ